MTWILRIFCRRCNPNCKYLQCKSIAEIVAKLYVGFILLSCRRKINLGWFHMTRTWRLAYDRTLANQSAPVVSFLVDDITELRFLISYAIREVRAPWTQDKSFIGQKYCTIWLCFKIGQIWSNSWLIWNVLSLCQNLKFSILHGILHWTDIDSPFF